MKVLTNVTSIKRKEKEKMNDKCQVLFRFPFLIPHDDIPAQQMQCSWVRRVHGIH